MARSTENTEQDHYGKQKMDIKEEHFIHLFTHYLCFEFVNTF